MWLPNTMQVLGIKEKNGDNDVSQLVHFLSRSALKMLGYSSLVSAIVTSTFFARSIAAQVIGPVTNLHIVNAPIAPDGFARQAVLAEGIFPGPIITANKVRGMTPTAKSHVLSRP